MCGRVRVLCVWEGVVWVRVCVVKGEFNMIHIKWKTC